MFSYLQCFHLHREGNANSLSLPPTPVPALTFPSLLSSAMLIHQFLERSKFFTSPEPLHMPCWHAFQLPVLASFHYLPFWILQITSSYVTSSRGLPCSCPLSALWLVIFNNLYPCGLSASSPLLGKNAGPCLSFSSKGSLSSPAWCPVLSNHCFTGFIFLC